MSDIDTQLLDMWRPFVEHCGFVLQDGTIVEVPNIHPLPHNGFHISLSAVEKYDSVASATWHTHPTTGPNLSVEDYYCFLAYPRLRHYIIAKKEAWCFYVENGTVLLHEDNLARQFERPLPRPD